MLPAKLTEVDIGAIPLPEDGTRTEDRGYGPEQVVIRPPPSSEVIGQLTEKQEIEALKKVIRGQYADLDERDRELSAILAQHAAELDRLGGGRTMVADKEFQVGDVVGLESGGPLMTVTAVVPARGDEAHALCRCLYFDGSMLPREVMVPMKALVVASCPCSWVVNAQRAPGCPRCGGPQPGVKEE
jgi:uncharacterized protein YodC (DUF2158 family)